MEKSVSQLRTVTALSEDQAIQLIGGSIVGQLGPTLLC